MWELVKIKVSCPRVSSPCGAWLPLTKIVLVGDNTPQNRSCGRWRTTKPFLRGSRTTTNTFLRREEGKHEMQMRCENAKEWNLFLLFLMKWRETRAKRAEEGRARNETGGTQARGVPWAPCALVLLEGRHPLARPTKVVGRPCGWPNLCPSFSVMLNDFHMIQKWVNECRGRPVQA